MAKAKLKQALAQFKGVDQKLERQKRLKKQAEKKKRSKAVDEEVELEEAEDGEDDEEDGGVELDLEAINDSDSSSNNEELTNGAGEDSKDDADGVDGVDGEDEEEEDIPFSDIASIASEDKGDIVPYQRLTINNITALQAAHKRIALPYSKLTFSQHQTITTAEPVTIEDVDDDLNRELAFYAQSLSAVKAARGLLKAEGVSFARPADYFAEMVKSDEHMGRVKAKLVDTAASKKASSEARRQRDLKKFGKQVQVAKLQERDKAKRETLDKINLLKRKNEPDLFDVELEDTATTVKKDRNAKRTSRGGANGAPNKRRKKDEKFGFGGKKRFAKSGDANSSADMKDYSVAKMKGRRGKARPGKDRRAAGRD
ncbi:eukaryotic rRNA processing [Tothia fuscella]|uniref:Eukaryotic rRNA processing n=1 Tax=Tothia fuscella TaxID=1048955 RepID=A0A9P4NQT9_9PEZI|nr:eukaryotic rRNA processing [Tothia fuscella]